MTKATVLAPFRVVVQIVHPTGRHRAPRPHAALATQRFVWCDPCRADVSATEHGAVVRCANGHIIPGGGR